MTRIIIVLNDEERDALRSIAEKEMRGFRDQARFMLRAQLVTMGELTAPVSTVYNPAPQTGDTDKRS